MNRKLNEDEGLFIRSMGKLVKITALFDNADKTNEYLEENQDEGVIAEFGSLVLVANNQDKGVLT